MRCKAPIVSLHFKRPEHSRQALLSLYQNEGAKDSELFIFCDGARNEREELQVQQVREVVRSQQWCGKVHIIERERNLGCFQNTVSAVTEICEKYGRVIFVEDDSLLSPYFLNYMNDALERYEYEPQVMHISAYLWPLKNQILAPFFLRSTNVWTFATWQRAWSQYHTDATSLLDKICFAGLEQAFSFDGMRNYVELLENEARGNIDDWSIYWAAIVFLNGLSLYPNCSLVKNIGFDGTGFHYVTSTSVYDTTLSQEGITNFPTVFQEDEVARQKFIEFFKSIQPRKGTVWERIIHKIKLKRFLRFMLVKPSSYKKVREMNLKAPIVSLHFNRPEHSRQSLLSLSQNEGAEDSEL